MTIKIASLFSGIGGFEKGFKQASEDIEIVFASDIDKYTKQIYRKNFGFEPHGDIKQIDAADVPGHDILVGGFPCQDLSIGGKREGLQGKRSSMFFEIIRILREKQPKLVLIENVKGFLSSNRGWDFARALVEMENVGYECEWQVFNSKNHGTPQNRERVYIIGHLGDGSFDRTFPIRTSSCMGYACPTLTSGYRKRRGEDGVYLKKQDKENMRFITPLEAERLQGFPDNWTQTGIDNNGEEVNISNHQRYKCLGNAVTVNVVECIARQIIMKSSLNF